jgi:arginyl-tRNA synthetase
VIAFDFEEALNFEGDTGPYLQYSLVRAENIFRKMAEKASRCRRRGDSRTRLGRRAVGDRCSTRRRRRTPPSARSRRSELATLARHAFNLAQEFNHFYHRQPIVQEPTRGAEPPVAIARIFQEEMVRLLDLLGIPPARNECDRRCSRLGRA